MLPRRPIEVPVYSGVHFGFAYRLIALLMLLALGGGGAVAYLGYVEPVAAIVHESTGQAVPRTAPTDATNLPSPEAASYAR